MAEKMKAVKKKNAAKKADKAEKTGKIIDGEKSTAAKPTEKAAKINKKEKDEDYGVRAARVMTHLMAVCSIIALVLVLIPLVMILIPHDHTLFKVHDSFTNFAVMAIPIAWVVELILFVAIHVKAGGPSKVPMAMHGEIIISLLILIACGFLSILAVNNNVKLTNEFIEHSTQETLENSSLLGE